MEDGNRIGSDHCHIGNDTYHAKRIGGDRKNNE